VLFYRVTVNWTPEADEQQAERERDQRKICRTTPDVHDKAAVDAFWKSYWAVNDIATALYLRGLALKELNKIEEAKEVFKTVILKYDCGFTFDPERPQFWWTKRGAETELRKLGVSMPAVR
jgi:hypothetical protein